MKLQYHGDRLSIYPQPKPEKRSTSKRKRDAVLLENVGAVYEHCFEREGGQCRIPGCSFTLPVRLEMAHLENKGMGGDHGFRTRQDSCLMLCARHHQGTRSLHSGHITFEFLTDRGADGPMTWTIREVI